MGLFNFLFGTNHVISEDGKSVIQKANDFAGFCRKIDKDERIHSPISYMVKTDSIGLIGVFAFFISDNTNLEVAYSHAIKGGESNERIAKLSYENMIRECGVTPAESRAFIDADHFVDVLRGEMSVITCKRTGFSRFEITRFLGYIPMYDEKAILTDIKISLLSSYSDVKIERDVDKKYPVNLCVKF